MSTEQLLLILGGAGSVIAFLFRALVKSWAEQRDFLVQTLERCQARGEQATGQASRAIDIAASTVKRDVDA